MKLFRPALGACGAALVAVSCVAPTAPPSAATPSSAPLGPYVRTPAEAGAQLPAGGPATLMLDGGDTDVTLRPETAGDDQVLRILLHGQETDMEVYQPTADAYLLRRAGGEIYEPALPLLKFPMHVGDSWTWEGKLRDGDQSASATIETELAKVSIRGSSVRAIQCRVDLRIDLKPVPARRELTFWFVKGKGVVQREFGDLSKRFPEGE